MRHTIFARVKFYETRAAKALDTNSYHLYEQSPVPNNLNDAQRNIVSLLWKLSLIANSVKSCVNIRQAIM